MDLIREKHQERACSIASCLPLDYMWQGLLLYMKPEKTLDQTFFEGRIHRKKVTLFCVNLKEALQLE